MTSRLSQLRQESRRLRVTLLGSIRLVWQAAARELVLVGVLQLASALLIVAQLVLARAAVSQIVKHGTGADISGSLIGDVVGILGVSAVLTLVSAVITDRRLILGELVSYHAQTRVLAVASKADYVEFETPSFHDRLQRALRDGVSRPAVIVTGLSTLLGSSLAVLALLGTLAVFAPLLLFPVGLVFVPLWLAAARNSRLQHQFGLEVTPSDRRRAYLGLLLTAAHPAKEIRSFNLSGWVLQRHTSLSVDRIAKVRAVSQKRLRGSVVATAVGAALNGGVFALLLYLRASGRLGIPETVAAGFAVVQLNGRIQGLVTGMTSVYEASLFVEHYDDFVRVTNREQSARRQMTTVKGPAHLVVEDLSFSYGRPGSPVLDHLSLEIRPGQTVALVGANGAGKTTLVKLIAQLYRPAAGRILLNGQDLATLDSDSVRRQVAVIYQDFMQYQFTARENIALGNIDRADETDDVIRAASLAGAHPFLADLPMGYETMLSREFEAGTSLSTGQWQRLALARALFRDSPLVLLDEPTASLDARAERALFDELTTAFADRSVLLISHRFSSVRMADYVYVLEGGQIIERGTHDELIYAGGLYRELFDLQVAAYQTPSTPAR